MQDLEETVYDYIVLGTGLTNALLASALARAGQCVLHLDTNDYYGEDWASFQLNALLQWCHHQTHTPNESVRYYEKAQVETVQSVEWTVSSGWWQDVVGQQEELADSLLVLTRTLVEQLESLPVESYPEALSNYFDRVAQQCSLKSFTSNTTPTGSQLNLPAYPSSPAWRDAAQCLIREYTTPNSPQVPETLHFEYLTLVTLLQHNRDYNLELVPKLTYCRGPLVDLLVSSGVGKYLEFRGMGQLYLVENERIIRAPNSKEDIFTSKELSLVEKRKLMKCLTALIDPDTSRSYLDEHGQASFTTFLKDTFRIQGKLLHAVLYTVALVDPTASVDCTVAEGIERIRQYVHSIGRYGNMALLNPVYGGGSELAQAFCRLTAVNGGIYMLDCDIETIKELDLDTTQVKGTDDTPRPMFEITVTPQRQNLKTRRLIASPRYVPPKWVQHTEYYPTMTRALILLDRPLLPGDDASLLALPGTGPTDSTTSLSPPVYALQLSHLARVVPEGLYVLYLFTEATDTAQSARQLLEPVLKRLLSLSPDTTHPSTVTQDNGKSSPGSTGTDLPSPKPLFSLYFKHRAVRRISTHPFVTDKATEKSQMPSACVVTTQPDPSLFFDSVVDEARQLFTSLQDSTSSEETPFLPPMPDPEETY
ncbi:hypothetical protein IWQ62_000906 [Dispira parvispora]|uniref:Rab proteins geranylgeranyltransferase component A n=1 Tax=Dispira parvispora TaxID=1520584 RepID=A0A9W8AZM7_9FUNG|nr:hypothetical protein IWQ62_000906 [Dispira parvispora]